MNHKNLKTQTALALMLIFATPLMAETTADYSITIKDHRFTPAEIRVPAGKAFTLLVINSDASPEEFESKSLKVEKIIAGGKEGLIKIRSLKPGTYEFVGEYHEDIAKGRIIVE
ncbi:MAG: cupredoxin domain-containing protein [Candidatus Pacebacteria bacterium]|nr:cupredoxin domain-containing protein [Candidatus Paceibacterota bacterium]